MVKASPEVIAFLQNFNLLKLSYELNSYSHRRLKTSSQ